MTVNALTTRDRTDSDASVGTLTFKEVLLTSFNDILNNFDVSARFNLSQSIENAVSSSNDSGLHHIVNIIMFKPMVKAFTDSVHTNLENVLRIWEIMKLLIIKQLTNKD